MEISKSNFLKAVNQVIPGIDKDANFTGADCIFFNNGTLKSFNDQLGFSIPLIPFEFQCAVNGKELQNILKKCKKDMIDFEFIPNESLKIKAGRIKAELNLIDTSDLIKKYEFFQDPVWSECTSEYFEILESVFIAKNSIDFEGVFVHTIDDGLEMYCTDNLRINKAVYNKKTDDLCNIWYPSEAVGYLLKHNITHNYRKDNFVVLKTDSGLEIIFRDYPMDAYPVDKLQGIFEGAVGSEDAETYQFDESVKEALDQMAVTSVTQFDNSVWTDAIKVKLEGNRVTFSGESDNAKMESETELTSPVSENFEGLEFTVSIGQLLKAIDRTLSFTLIENILYFETDTVNYLVCVA